MKILQSDVDNITYEPVRPEAGIYDDVRKEKTSVDDTLVIFVSVEEGDTQEMANKAIKDTEEYMKKLDRKRLVIYPFAHLSNSLAGPNDARKILEYMVKQVSKSIEVRKAPFGWNKKLSVDIKVHPLAEQFRSYSPGGEEQKIYKKVKPMSVNTALVRKSSWAGLADSDHRTIGEKLDLYSFQEVSPGMVYWHNNGYIVFKELMRYIREKLDEYGYQEVGTPAFANIALWHVSGHIEKYRGEMFIIESEGQEVGLKPMNCPSAILIFKSRKWSYKDLPLRLADFDKLYRNELSGTLTGLFRVREMTQDDAHLFMTNEQVEDELTNMLRLVKELYSEFELSYTARLSTMPDNHLGDEKLWEKATSALRSGLASNKIKYEIKEKEGAFYGPKIDFDIKDSMGREWQCATIQLDYQLPQRFNLEYTGEDGRQHTPVMMHRVIYGSLERFIGILTEHLQGKFPTWLAPVQVKIVTISQQLNEYAESVYKELKKEKIRIELDKTDRTLEHKLRDAIIMKIPYIIVIGKKEEEKKTITVRSRSGTQKHDVSVADFSKALKDEIDSRANKLMY